MFSFQLLLAQACMILLVARLMGWLFRKLHQPAVMGEMVAGVCLGPSCLGWLAPDLFAALFPAASLGHLSALSQFGLLVFMFLMGLELDLNQLRELGRAAVSTSLASILVPLFLGLLLAFHLYPRFSQPSVNFTGFALFMGAAMSITAFPILARILIERNLLRTKVGSLAITCAAVNDVAAWCLLAGIIVLVRAGSLPMPLWLLLASLAAFTLLMLLVVRRGLRSLVTVYEKQQGLTHGNLALILFIVLASGWSTESLGVHALFGAFLAGIAMPRHHAFARELFQRLEALAVVLLLPLYFASTGLRSSFWLIAGAEMWFYCAVIIVLAILGKWGGSLVAAKASGLPWREAAAVGVLLNTRGLVELVILNIGLELGVLSPALFSMLVLMTLVTTLMTAPLLKWIYPAHMVRRETQPAGP